MKRLFDFLMRKYYFGLKWYASSGIEEELIAQVFYIQALICGLRILYQIDPQKILGYITFTIFHILSMYILGYLSSLWELDPKEEIFTNTYRTVNIVLAIGAILAKVPCYILLIVGATICGFVSFILMEKIDDFENTLVTWKNRYAHTLFVRIFDKIPYKPIALIDFLSMIFAIIAINTLPISIIYRFIISIIYGLYIPFIVVMADDGMSFYEAML